MVEAVVIRRRTDGVEADRLLDELEVVIGMQGEPVSGGRRYDLTESRDWLIAIASMEGHLDELSAGWRDHLQFEAQ